MKKGLWISMAAALLLLVGCSGQAQMDAPELMQPVGVKMDTAVVQRGEICEIESYDFAVTPQTQEVRFAQDGRVDEVCAVLGQQVKKGDVLLRMDVEEIEQSVAELDRRIAYLEQDHALTLAALQLDVEICNYEMEEQNRDYAHGGRKEQEKIDEMERANLALKQEKERQALEMAQLEQQRETLKEQLADSELLAPCDGTVLMQSGSSGSSVRAGDTALVLAVQDEMVIQGEYISQALAQSADEVQAWINGKNVAVEYLPMDSEEYLSLLLSGGELTARFSFTQGVPSGVACGDYVLVLVKTQQRTDVLYLPPNAVSYDATGYYVYLADDAGGRTRRSVETGVRTSTAVEILDGLKEGDEVYVQ